MGLQRRRRCTRCLSKRFDAGVGNAIHRVIVCERFVGAGNAIRNLRGLHVSG